MGAEALPISLPVVACWSWLRDCFQSWEQRQRSVRAAPRHLPSTDPSRLRVAKQGPEVQISPAMAFEELLGLRPFWPLKNFFTEPHKLLRKAT